MLDVKVSLGALPPVPVTRACSRAVKGTGRLLLRCWALFLLRVPVTDSLFPLRKVLLAAYAAIYVNTCEAFLK